jgi:hypothetical protein
MEAQALSLSGIAGTTTTARNGNTKTTRKKHHRSIQGSAQCF